MPINPIQLFDAVSSTFTYILAGPENRDAVIIDPVDQHWERDLAHIERQVQAQALDVGEVAFPVLVDGIDDDQHWERDLAHIERLGLHLAYILETHAHADHVTSAGRLRQLTGAKAAVPSGCGIPPAEVQFHDGDTLRFGDKEVIDVIHTPGHTAGSMCYLWRGNLFSGDTLLIDGCGRTDFQGGSAEALYDSVTRKLFALPDATRVWPGHDYKGQSVTTIGWEKQHNARLAGRSREEFVALMAALKLPQPRMIDVAVPANRNLGLDYMAS